MTFDSLTAVVSVGSLVWGVLSGALNVLFWFKSPEEWVSFAERNPRSAAVIRLLRGWGFDPMKGLVAIRDLARKRTAGAGPSVRPPAYAPPPPASMGTPASVFTRPTRPLLDPQTDAIIEPPTDEKDTTL